MGKESIKMIANNKKARHDYFLEELYEAGISLHGTEVKSLRMGKCSIKESFIHIEHGEVIIYGMHISPYEKGNIFNRDPLRPKKLLMHKNEIRKLEQKIKEKKYASEQERMEKNFYVSLILPKDRLHLPKVRSFMISVMILQRKICAVKQKGISR